MKLTREPHAACGPQVGKPCPRGYTVIASYPPPPLGVLKGQNVSFGWKSQNLLKIADFCDVLFWLGESRGAKPPTRVLLPPFLVTTVVPTQDQYSSHDMVVFNVFFFFPANFELLHLKSIHPRGRFWKIPQGSVKFQMHLPLVMLE